MLFHVNTALFLPLKPSNFRYSAQIFVGHSTKNPPSFPAFVFALPPKILHRYSIVSPSILHRFDGPVMEQPRIYDLVSSSKLRNKKNKKRKTIVFIKLFLLPLQPIKDIHKI